MDAKAQAAGDKIKGRELRRTGLQKIRIETERKQIRDLFDGCVAGKSLSRC